ncbi:MAG: hypothetical protein AAGF89_03180, partial [Bacteroidota bacterium]
MLSFTYTGPSYPLAKNTAFVVLRWLGIPALVLFLFAGLSAQTFSFSEDFEGFATGDSLAASSADWMTINGGFDLVVSDQSAIGGGQALELTAGPTPREVFRAFPQVANSGNLIIDFGYFITNSTRGTVRLYEDQAGTQLAYEFVFATTRVTVFDGNGQQVDAFFPTSFSWANFRIGFDFARGHIDLPRETRIPNGANGIGGISFVSQDGFSALDPVLIEDVTVNYFAPGDITEYRTIDRAVFDEPEAWANGIAPPPLIPAGTSVIIEHYTALNDPVENQGTISILENQGISSFPNYGRLDIIGGTLTNASGGLIDLPGNTGTLLINGAGSLLENQLGATINFGPQTQFFGQVPTGTVVQHVINAGTINFDAVNAQFPSGIHNQTSGIIMGSGGLSIRNDAVLDND